MNGKNLDFNKKPFIIACISGAIAGGIAAAVGASASGLVILGILIQKFIISGLTLGAVKE